MAAIERTVVVLDHGAVFQDHALAIALGLPINALLHLCPRPVLRLRGAR
jgi:hypothetical protein